MRHLFFFLFILSSFSSFATSDLDTKKSYLEDIFIWRMSDELKLSAAEEKKFTLIHKELNKRKAELNKAIQESTQALDQPSEAQIKKLRQSIRSYNELSLSEFDSMKKLLGLKKFAEYLQVKSELTNKVKSLLSGEKNGDKDRKESANPNSKLPPPQVIIEK